MDLELTFRTLRRPVHVTFRSYHLEYSDTH